MGNYGSDRRGGRSSGGSRDGGRGRSSFGRSDDRPELFGAVCDKCGNDCKVPFRPSGDKPVFCSDCFEQESGRSTRGGDRDGSRGRSSYGDRSERSSFGGRDSGGDDKLMRKMDFVENKLDRIVGMLEELKNAKTYRVEKEVKDDGLDVI